MCVRLGEPAPMLGKNHLIFHLSGSLWVVPPLHRPLQSKIPLVSVKTALAVPPLPQHTPRGIENALTPNQWKTVEKSKKREGEKNLLSNII